MKPQIYQLHANRLAVQPSTIFNPKTNLGLLWRALIMLLLIAAMVAPGAAQGIYVSNNPHSGTRQAYIGAYRLNGTTVNSSLVTMPSNSFVEGLALSGLNLFVPSTDLNTNAGTVRGYDATNGNPTGFSLSMQHPHAVAVLEGKLFVANLSNGISLYDATTGTPLNLSLIHSNVGYIAAAPGPLGTVNLFVTYPGWTPHSGSVQELTVKNNAVVLGSQRTLVSNLDYPQGIAVSEDGNHVYFVIPNTNPLTTDGEIDDYDVLAQTWRRLVPNISGTPWGLALSGSNWGGSSNLFVTLRDGNAVGEYTTYGTTVNAALINNGLDYPLGIAVVPGDGTRYCTPPPSGMAAWYSFDQDLGQNQLTHAQYDLANGNDAIAHLTQPVTPGKVANALSFDGVQSYVEAPHNASLDMGTGDFSIDAWVQIPASASTGLYVIVDQREYTQGVYKGYHFFLYNGYLGVQLADGPGGYSNYLSSRKVPTCFWGLCPWHLVAVTVSRAANVYGSFYVDGSPWGNFIPGHLGNLNNSAPLEIGVREAGAGGGGFFRGNMDEVEIFNRALRHQDVFDIFQAGPAGKCK